MHELSIALSIIDVASAEAERCSGGGVVAAIHIKLGLLSGVVKEALLSAYDLAREGSPLVHAKLIVEEVSVVIYCEHCEAERPAESMQSIRCATCRTPSTRIVSGRDLEIAALEIQE